MQTERKKYIEELTSNIRDSFEISVPITDMSSIVKKLGGEVKYTQNVTAYERVRVCKQKDAFTVFVSSDVTFARANFNVATALGHLFLHMGYIINEEKWEKQNTDAKFSNKEYEEATVFAMFFLMPEDSYREVLDTYSENTTIFTRKIANHFNVPLNVAINRGNTLGLIAYWP